MKKVFKYCPFCKCKLCKVSAEGRIRLACKKCGWINYNNPLPVVVCAAVRSDKKILIVKRNHEPGKNKWSLPGGFIEYDEKPEKACLRELKEETGVEGEIIKLAGVYLRRVNIYGSLIVIGYLSNVIKENIHINNEIKEAKFVDGNDIPYIPFYAHRRIIKHAISVFN